MSQSRQTSTRRCRCNARMSISHTQTASSADRARLFRDLHTSGRPLVLPNAWDVAGARVEVPLNVLAGPGARTVAELARLGVARVSLGSSIAEAAYAVVRRAARE
jgi:2-methylisocitrate lyase-like PEP mutase family enzyme